MDSLLHYFGALLWSGWTDLLDYLAAHILLCLIPAFGGFILAICFCTILPLPAGIWKRGADLGSAVTFLFISPAFKILAITYANAAIGFDIAVSRLFSHLRMLSTR